MKRSELLQKLEDKLWFDLMHTSEFTLSACKGEAESILSYLEQEGLCLVDEQGEAISYEPEEGWEAWIEAEDEAAEARDFELPDDVASKKTRAVAMVNAFLAGYDFDAIAQDFNVTRERVRQVVAKYRRSYKGVK